MTITYIVASVTQISYFNTNILIVDHRLNGIRIRLRYLNVEFRFAILAVHSQLKCGFKSNKKKMVTIGNGNENENEQYIPIWAILAIYFKPGH